MKRNIYFLMLLCVFLFVGCSDDDTEPVIEPTVKLEQNEINDISYLGQTCEVAMSTGADWTAQSLVDWCTVLTAKGNGNHKLVFTVQANMGEARDGEIVVYAQEEKFSIKIRQQPCGETGEFHYCMPVIFHVIYNDASDPKQNPSAQVIYDMLHKANDLYSSTANRTVDMNLEFVPAEYDSRGNKLEEPGIERIYWPQERLDPTTFMDDKTGKYTHFMWEPKDFVNIFLYPFSVSEYLGVSTFPYNPAEDPEHQLEGLEQAPVGISLKNLKFVYGVSINSTYLNDVEDVFVPYIKDPAMKELFNRQSKIYVTLAHELGHYLGLRHTFSEILGDWLADTDLCSDTGSYIRFGLNGYEQTLSKLYDRIKDDPIVAETFDWESLFWRDGDATFGHYQARNIMDYSYCYLDEFTPQQRDRVRFVLQYSPLIPGPKNYSRVASRSVDGMVDLKVTLSDGYPLGLSRK